MKIGVTTFQWSDNYGAVLQAYALQSFLQQRGHEVEIVDYRKDRKRTIFHTFLAKTPSACLRKWHAAYKTYLFDQFRRKHLNLTQTPFYSSQDLGAIRDRYDMLITGSDQVWNPRWLEQRPGFFDLYFL